VAGPLDVAAGGAQPNHGAEVQERVAP
jgi:hypothetical protein